MNQTEQMKQAIENSDAAAVRELLAQGYAADAQYEIINHSGFQVVYTALMQAADAGSAALAQLLLDAGADAALESGSGDTALFAAAGQDDLEVLTLLIGAGVNVSYANRDGWTALMAASHNGSAEAVKALLWAGADAKARDSRGNTAFTTARAGCRDVLAALAAAGAEPPTEEDLGQWRLSLGQYYDCQTACDPNYFKTRNELGETMLTEACRHRDFSRVNEMMRHGANPGVRDKSGRCAADYAAMCNLDLAGALEAGDAALAQAALADGADVNISYYFSCGQSEPLTMLAAAAALDCGEAVVRTLLDAGADAKAKDRNGETALHFARNKDAAALLLQAGANVNARSKDGETPLFRALRHVNGESGGEAAARLCNALIDAGADVRAKDKEGRHPLDMVAEDKFAAVPPSLIAKLLFPRKEAKPEAKK